MDPIRLVMGIALLAFGRKLYWLMVGVIGFVVGYLLAGEFFSGAAEWLLILIGIIVGLIGAGLAIFLQSIAIAIAGFLGGGYVTIQLLTLLGISDGTFSWIPFILGGILGLILVSLLFDWALIVLSSLIGAFMVTQVIDPNLDTSSFIFFILLIIGIVIQALVKRREQERQ
jgi:MFS family permease